MMKSETNQGKLVAENRRYVETVAKQYLNHGLTQEQLIEEGNKGLVKAAKRYDPSKGYSFMSYAVWWVRQSMLQALVAADREQTVEQVEQIFNRRNLKKQ